MADEKFVYLEEVSEQLEMINDESYTYYNTEKGGFAHYS